MKQNPRVLVAGSVNMDLFLNMRTMPRSGESVIARDYGFTPGGKGGNQAVSAALLGADTHFCGRIGEDGYGRLLEESLRRNGVTIDGLTRDASEPTGLAAILREEDGSNRILVYPGANMRLTADRVILLMDQIRPDAFLLQFEIPQQTVICCCQAARQRNIPVVADAGPAQPFPLEKIAGMLIFSPNETETATLCGILPDTDARALQAAKALMNRTQASFVIIKRGGKGAFVYDGDQLAVNLPAVPVQAVDTTAAGDAFMAAVTVAYWRTRDIIQAVRYANAVGALTVSRPGTQVSLPTGAQADDLIARIGK